MVMARNSVKIGIVMLIVWALPVAGLPLGTVGLFYGLKSYPAPRPVTARAGIFLNCLGITLSLLNLGVSIYLLRSGILSPDLLN